jgi:hypothetical protein
VPMPGEPSWLTDNQRPKFGMPGVYPPIGGVYARTPALKEDLQYRCLWNIEGYNNQPATNVPAFSGPDSITEVFPVATANVPDYALLDATHTKIYAYGDFTAGSFEPRMHFKIGMGQIDQPEYTLINARKGILRGDPTIAGSGVPLSDEGIRISQQVAGENSLQYEEKFPWMLEIDLFSNGTRGVIPFSTSGATDATVFCRAIIQWGPGYSYGMEGANYHTPGPLVQGTNMAYDPSKTYARGTRTVYLGEGYQAIAPSTGIVPGADPLWMLYWYKLKHKAEIFFSEAVDLDQRGYTITLYAGGPHQMSKVKAYTDFAGAPNILAATTAIMADQNANATGAVIENGITFVPRRDGLKTGNPNGIPDYLAPDPVGDPDGLWNRDWKAIGADRKDEMNIHGMVAFMVGGRRGVGGTVIE